MSPFLSKQPTCNVSKCRRLPIDPDQDRILQTDGHKPLVPQHRVVWHHQVPDLSQPIAWGQCKEGALKQDTHV